MVGILFFLCSYGYADQAKQYADEMDQYLKNARQSAFELFEYFDDINRMLDIVAEDPGRIDGAKREFDRNTNLCAKTQDVLHKLYTQAELNLAKIKNTKPVLAAEDLKNLEEKLNAIQALDKEGHRYSCDRNRDLQGSLPQMALTQQISNNLAEFVNKLKSNENLKKAPVSTAQDKPEFPSTSRPVNSPHSESNQSGSVKPGR